MTRDEAEAALQAWATVQRDELVHAARQAGVSKNRIHVITGIARTTIDRILEAPVGTSQEALTAYLAKFTARWARPQPQWGWTPSPTAASQYTPTAASQYTPADVAGQLLADAEFRALRLGTWLGTPSGELFAAAAEAVAPPPYREDIELLVEALKVAAKRQHDEAWTKILAGVAIGGLVGAIAYGSSQG